MALKTPLGPRCHIILPPVQIATYGLPKNLARVFDKNTVIFTGFHGPRGRFYLAKRQGYVASGFSRRFLALSLPFFRIHESNLDSYMKARFYRTQRHKNLFSYTRWPS